MLLHRSAPRYPDGKAVLAPYSYDGAHPTNALVAGSHRFARIMPIPDESTVTDYTVFAKEFIRRRFNPITPENVPTHDEWLEGTSYSAGRRNVLRLLLRKIERSDRTHLKCKSFIKNEVMKKVGQNPRAINSYSDEAKTLVGRWISALDKGTFSVKKHFVKGSNPATWPARLVEMFGDRPVASTDFSSFEAHHTAHFADIITYWMEHMFSRVKLPIYVKRLLDVMVQGRNLIEFKNVTMQCDQRLMSGAMWTSSANSILNLTINAFLSAQAQGLKGEDAIAFALGPLTGLCEGDDGLFVDYGQNAADAARLGAILKFEHHPTASGAGFCGIICDTDSLVVLKDPIQALRKFFTLPNRYLNSRQTVKDALLRAKAMSMATYLTDCPVLGPLAEAVLYRTRSLAPNYGALDAWAREQIGSLNAFDHTRKPDIAPKSRVIMEEHFNCSLSEQLLIEAAIAKYRVNGNFIMPHGWRHNEDDQWFVSTFVTDPEGLFEIDHTISPAVRQIWVNMNVRGMPGINIEKHESKYALNTAEFDLRNGLGLDPNANETGD